MPKPMNITHNGETRSIRGWAKYFGVPDMTFRYRFIALGLSFDKAGSQNPVRSRKNKFAYKGVCTVENGKTKRILEHVLIAEKALGRVLPEGVQVHHVDLDPANNAPSNLVLCPNQKYHRLLHRRTKAIESCGNPNFRKCVFCKQYDEPIMLYISPDERTVHHRRCLAEYRRNKL